jgi:hypothetical protein
MKTCTQSVVKDVVGAGNGKNVILNQNYLRVKIYFFVFFKISIRQAFNKLNKL